MKLKLLAVYLLVFSSVLAVKAADFDAIKADVKATKTAEVISSRLAAIKEHPETELPDDAYQGQFGIGAGFGALLKAVLSQNVIDNTATGGINLDSGAGSVFDSIHAALEVGGVPASAHGTNFAGNVQDFLGSVYGPLVFAGPMATGEIFSLERHLHVMRKLMQDAVAGGFNLYNNINDDRLPAFQEFIRDMIRHSTAVEIGVH
ncbi:MAG: hypothetical protein IJT36_02515 [Alphaproteobacteria bacterium]|nr:hypothetical protein [Alphaproteobacteria bacterium]